MTRDYILQQASSTTATYLNLIGNCIVLIAHATVMIHVYLARAIPFLHIYLVLRELAKYYNI